MTDKIILTDADIVEEITTHIRILAYDLNFDNDYEVKQFEADVRGEINQLLAEKLKEQDLELSREVDSIIFDVISDCLYWSYIDWQSRTKAHIGTSNYIKGFIEQVTGFADSKIKRIKSKYKLNK